MTQKDLTFIGLVVDRSGSMGPIKKDMQGGINQFIEDQTNQSGKCMVTFTEFDDQFDILYDYENIAKVTQYTLVPRGGTALLDAIGSTIKSMETRIASLPLNHQPEKVIVMIVTDGGENQSQTYKGEAGRENIKGQITRLTDDENWQFIFLGANQDAITVASTMGISQQHSLTFAAAGAGVHNTYGSTSSLVSSMRLAPVATMSNVAYSSADRTSALDTTHTTQSNNGTQPIVTPWFQQAEDELDKKDKKSLIPSSK